MATITQRTASTASTEQSVTPLLENGDRLTRAEFERRYIAMPQLKKAELVEGVVHMPSPTSLHHAIPHGHLTTFLGNYSAVTSRVQLGDNATVRLDLENELQPDALLRVDPASGGQSRTSPDGFIDGPPELVAEVATSSASYDLNAKLHVYRRSGVREYLVWRTFDKAIDWFALVEGNYAPLAPTADGVLKSQCFPGLWLARDKMLAGDMKGVLETLQQGLRSPEHAQFMSLLQGAEPTSAG